MSGFRCFACFLVAGFLCDWKLPSGALCNRSICPDHATKVDDHKHLCPEHQEAYAAWKAKREAKEVSHGTA